MQHKERSEGSMGAAGTDDSTAMVSTQTEQPSAEIEEDHPLDASTLSQEASIKKSKILLTSCRWTFEYLNVNDDSDSVEEVKRKVQEEKGIPVDEQWLILGGEPLQPGHKFLRDYNPFGHQAVTTIHVSRKVSDWFLEMTLPDFKAQAASLTRSVPIPEGQVSSATVWVLSELGRRILHGVMSCFLRAHEAGSAYDGLCKMDNMMVAVHRTRKPSCQKLPSLVVSRVYIRNGMIPSALDSRSQRSDYRQLRKIIAWLFGPSDVPLHVRSILALLANLSAIQSTDITMEKSTRLLQAYAAMVDPVPVASMCLNLKRFYDQLDALQKPRLEKAMETAQNKTDSLIKVVQRQSLFQKVYDHVPLYSNGIISDQNATNTAAGAEVNRRPTNQYTGNTGMELFNFARNWFTHVPTERWLSSHGIEAFEGLPHLDHIFTHHFSNFMPEALLQLYKNFDDYDMITNVLVPFA